MEKHSININVLLDKDKMPEHIDWSASGSNQDTNPQAKAFMLSLWDGAEKTALRMDLWTKHMMVDEMYDFLFQTLITMADTCQRSTRNEELSNELKEFAYHFKKKANEDLMKDSNENNNN